MKLPTLWHSVLAVCLFLCSTFVYAQPDLRVSWDNYPSQANPGQTVFMDIIVKNDGSSSASPSIAHYRLHDWNNNFVTTLATDNVGSLSPGGDSDEGASATLPTNLTTCRQYYLVARADATNTNAESNENNNDNSKPLWIGTPPSVDLHPSWNTSPATASAGATINIIVDVHNTGSSGSGGSCTMRYYWSTNQTFESGTDILLGSDGVGAIPAFDSEDENASLTLPSNVSFGTYYLLAIVDTQNEICETDETDNLAATPIEIGAPPAICELRKDKQSWDWRGDELYETFINVNGVSTPQLIPSPWFSNNFINDQIHDFVVQNPKDYEPDEGWVLIQRDFGTATLGTTHPYFILYNKYSGILRLFIALAGDYEEGNYSDALVTLEFQNTNRRTAILEHYTKDFARSALDRFDNTITRLEVSNEFSNDQPFWWQHADFVMNYDPCTCESEAFLKFNVRLVNDATLNFSLNGTAVPQIDQTGRQNSDGVQTIQNALNFVDGSVSNYKKLNTAVSTFNSIIGATAPAAVASSAATGGLALGPVLALGAFWVTASKFGQSSSNKPATYDINLEGSGNLLSTTSGTERSFSIPGSDNTNLDPPALLDYNNTLGVFSLNETPTVVWGIEPMNGYCPYNDHWEHRVKLVEDLSYSINPAAGFDLSKSEIKAAFIIKSNDNANAYQGGTMEDAGLFDIGPTGDGYTNYYSTKFYPIGCLNEGYILERNFFKSAGRVWIKINARLETPDGNFGIYTATYEVDLQIRSNASYPCVWADDDLQFDFDSSWWGSPNGFDCEEFLAPDNARQVCFSRQYSDLAFGRINSEELAPRYGKYGKTDGMNQTVLVKEETAQITAYPNPANTELNVSVTLGSATDLELSIVALNGSSIEKTIVSQPFMSEGQHDFNVSVHDLPAGMYVIRAASSNWVEHTRFVVAH